ncbi:MAG: hypothetical protein RLZZ490_2581, partial [Cyanobacteriota bacterium]
IIEIWTTPIYGQGDKVIYALVLLQDVTTRKQAEQLLRDYNQALAAAVKQKTQEIMMAQQQAERANQAKSLLLRNMSHELKTPLHVIIGFTNLMLQDLDYSENDALPLSKIRQNARHLLLVINNLLDLSKIQQGKLNTDSQWIELVDFVTEIQENFQLNAQAKNLAFTVHFLTPCPPLVQVDVIKLRQILFNLLSNAFKFTLVGKVSIRVACDQLTADKARLDFWIEDTGVGISQLAQKHLFRDFYRGDVLDVITEGTGLGLALTKQYVHLLGGKIDLISEQEKGTCVHFFVPVPITATAVNWVHHADEVVGQPDGDGFPISRLPSLLTTLAPQWHQAFYESLRKLDEARMLALLAEIRPSHPELSRYLEGLVKNLEFQLLLDLFLALISPGDRQ